MKNREYIFVGAAVGLVAAGFVAQKLLANPEVRRRLREFADRLKNDNSQWRVDLNSEQSFPASDPPSFTPTTAGSMY